MNTVCKPVARARLLQGAVVALLLWSAQTFALDLQSAKAQGLVGETSSGYLEPVNGSSEAAALAKTINVQRQAEYARIAAANGLALKDVELLAAQKAIAKTPPGQYVKVDGRWQKK
jgi:uncharacterized protein YdbL (DUF1318 family)